MIRRVAPSKTYNAKRRAASTAIRRQIILSSFDRKQRRRLLTTCARLSDVCDVVAPGEPAREVFNDLFSPTTPSAPLLAGGGGLRGEEKRVKGGFGLPFLFATGFDQREVVALPRFCCRLLFRGEAFLRPLAGVGEFVPEKSGAADADADAGFAVFVPFAAVLVCCLFFLAVVSSSSSSAASDPKPCFRAHASRTRATSARQSKFAASPLSLYPPKAAIRLQFSTAAS